MQNCAHDFSNAITCTRQVPETPRPAKIQDLKSTTRRIFAAADAVAAEAEARRRPRQYMHSVQHQRIPELLGRLLVLHLLMALLFLGHGCSRSLEHVSWRIAMGGGRRVVPWEKIVATRKEQTPEAAHSR